MGPSRIPNQKPSGLQPADAGGSLGPAMHRRIAVLSLLCAWLCASGAVLDVAQALAWTRMFADYAGTESVAAAAKDTFDPAKPCKLCLAVSAARSVASHRGPAAPAGASEKIVLMCQGSELAVTRCCLEDWPEQGPLCAVDRAEDVPLPPPRSRAA
jgi:hypothetical protein